MKHAARLGGGVVLTSVLAFGAVSVFGVLGSSGPAQAGPAPLQHIDGATVPVPPALLRASTKAGKSTDSAGYSATYSAGLGNFSGSLTVPTVTCPSGVDDSMYADIDLLNASGQTASAGWLLQCNGGSLEYINSFIEVENTIHDSTGDTDISAGDVINFNGVENTTAGTYTLTLTDKTTGWSTTSAEPIAPSFTSLNAGLYFNCTSGCSGNGVSPIPTFTTVPFNKLTFNNTSLASFSPTKFQLYNGSTLQVSVGAVAKSGTFTDTFVHD